MPVNPDAYMSGAIPSLSRGGSWQNIQDAQNPHQALDSMSFASPAPGGSIYPRPSQIVPPSPGASGMGNRTNMHFSRHPWAMNPALPQSPLSQQHAPSHGYAPSQVLSGSGRSQYYTAVEGSSASQRGAGGGSMMSGRAPAVGPTRHPGWTGLPGGGYRTSPSSPTTYAPTITPPHSPTIHGHSHGIHSVPATASPHHSSFTLQAGPLTPNQKQQQQHEWEWASGSPKPMTAEPDYFSPQHPRSQASEKHFIPAPKVMSLRLPSPKQRSRAGATLPSPSPSPLPPPPQSGRLRLDASPHRLRPTPSRRHTSVQDSTPREEVDGSVPKSQVHAHSDSKNGGEQRRMVQSPYLPLDLDSIQGYGSKESYHAPSKSASASGTHLSALRCSSAEEKARSQSAKTPTFRRSHSYAPSSGSKATSLTERRLKQSGGVQGRPTLPTIISNGSTVDFTSSQAPASARASSRTVYDMGAMQDALPPAPATASPSGHFSQFSEDDAGDYDRYTAHPAMPTHSRADSGQQTPLRMDVKTITAAEYRPPCFPPVPSKNLKWNREGPAMKTHGIAWMRDAPEGPLPSGPQGPRWAQARPPNLDLPQDGNWWESGVG